jgi:hypothetical protein
VTASDDRTPALVDVASDGYYAAFADDEQLADDQRRWDAGERQARGRLQAALESGIASIDSPTGCVIDASGQPHPLPVDSDQRRERQLD